MATASNDDVRKDASNGDVRKEDDIASGHQTNILVEDFLSSATIHGLHKAASNRNLIRRWVWTVLLLVMPAGLCTFTYLELRIYFQFETRTSTSVLMKNEIEVPAITICNANQVKSSILNCADMEYLIFYLSELSKSVTLPVSYPVNVSAISADDIFRCVREHSHDLDMFQSCFVGGRLVNCSHIFKPSLTLMGMCFTFNGVLPQRKTQMHGYMGGLRVVIDIEQDLYFFPEKMLSGIKVLLHEPEETPVPNMRSFLVGPGLSAEAVLSRNKRILLPSPYGNCVERESDIERLTRFSKYSTTACGMECFQNAVVSRCSCRHYYVNDLYIENSTGLSEAVQNCRTCPELCITYSYDWSLSYALFSSGFVNNRLVNASIFREESYIRSNYIDLTLFYNSLSENVVEDVPAKMINDIVGNVGGHMGMFLGASLLSIVELVEFACLLIAKQRSVSPTSTDKKHKLSTVSITNSTKCNITKDTENTLHLEET
ncbi:acid-sensing ion channel 4-A-like [Ylistrum balloti]|uniref:acid-sensing ion channel 4-A-like n=1 Tax=Ylistrum balloti TaxID=509963 RepID=UPI0029058EA1|nr:acid-sensing ion channel 4-A-like [Ylistrum balloti]